MGDALRPLEDHVIYGPNAYNLLNNVELGNYDQAYYIEKEGLHINYVLEDEEEESVGEEPEDNLPQEERNDTSLSSSNPLVASYGTYDNLVTIPFTHPLPSPGVTFEGLTGLQTPECRMDPIDQSSTMVTALL